jgi:DUF1126 PH-like domain
MLAQLCNMRSTGVRQQHWIIFAVSERVLCEQSWLESEGIELNPVEDCPLDPYMEARLERTTVKKATTPSDFDKLRQFLEMDCKVLRFYCVWDDRDTMFGQLRKFILLVSINKYIT